MNFISKAQEMFVLQSRENLENSLEAFKQAINLGLNPNEVKEQIFNELSITDEDLTDSDADELMRQVEYYYQLKNN